MQRVLLFVILFLFWGLVVVGAIRQWRSEKRTPTLLASTPFINTPRPSTPRPWPTLTPIPTQTPPTLTINGLLPATFIGLSPDVVAHSQQIFRQGQTLGRNPHAYSKVGDSTIQNPHFMAIFDQPTGYNLGRFAYLQPTIDYFAGSHGRSSTAVQKGLHAWTVNDPLWADKSQCLANESPINCEIRLHNPAILIIRLGSNDRGIPDTFAHNIRQLVELALSQGIIPVLGTKADRFEGSNINNDILRQIAADYQIPLWDFDLVAQTIPGQGLEADDVHLTSYFASDYDAPEAFQRGHGAHNLAALMLLNALQEQVILPVQSTDQ